MLVIKKFLKVSSFLIILCFGFHAIAQSEIDTNDYSNPNNPRYKTAGAAGAVGAAGGIYSFSKYRASTKLIAENTEIITGVTGEPKTMSGQEIRGVSGRYLDGDRAIIIHNLNEQKNRQLWVERLENEISSDRSTASMDRGLAAAALIPQIETYTDSNGNSQTRMGQPNYAGYAMYTAMAANADADAQRTSVRLGKVMAGAPVTFIDLELKIDTKIQAPAEIERNLSGLVGDGGKIVKISRLPAEAVQKLKKFSRLGAIGTAVGVLGAVGAGEELIFGYGSDYLHGNRVSDQIQRYDSQGNR